MYANERREKDRPIIPGQYWSALSSRRHIFQNGSGLVSTSGTRMYVKIEVESSSPQQEQKEK